MMAAPTFPNADLLSLSMPDEPFVVFLRACLVADGESAARLLQDGKLEALLQRRAAARRLLPLLNARLKAAGLAVEPRTAALLHTALLWEKTRAQRIDLILSEALILLERAGLAPVVVGGLACASLAYSQDAPRHCHDINLTLEPHALHSAEETLRMSGYAADPRSRPRQRTLHHASGIMIRLHAMERPMALQQLPGTAYRTLGTADALGQLLIHSALSGKLHDWAWIADATLLSRASIDRQALHVRILEMASNRRCALAMGLRLQWLTEAGLIHDDTDLVGGLRALAEGDSFTQVAPFLMAACSASGQSGRQLFRRSSSPRARRAILLWAASNRLRQAFA